MFMTTNLSSSIRGNPIEHISISLPVSEMRGLVDVLQTTVQNVCMLLEAEDCSVALLDTEHNKLVTLAAFQKQSRISFTTQLQEKHDVASWVAEHREALVINNASNDPRFKQLDPVLTGSVVFVPLIDRDNFIGILTVSRTESGAFSSHELHLLTIFAEQATITIINTHQAELARRDTARTKAHFISMITHELRSPLNSINGYLDLALEGIAGDLNQQQREFMQRARSGSEYLYVLIEDLLLISRADAGQLRLNRDLIRLPEVVTNAIEELELIAMDNEITISREIASDLPQIYADAVRMQQVVRNLINNALRFTPPGGSVTISARVNNNPLETAAAESIEINKNQQQIEVQIRDTGYGIAPEYHKQIFDRFYQIPGVNGRVSGQGLGLTIVKMIVELHGGRVSVESMTNSGSTFNFTLPL
jgi:signal transduction histidine kinase